MDAQAFTEALGREGYDEVFAKTALVTQVLGRHSHPFAVKALVTDGQLTLGIGGALTVYRRGDVFVLPLECEHTEEVGPAGVTYVVGRKNAKA